MILIVLKDGEVDCVETDGINNNRIMVVKNDPPIYDDMECLETWEPGNLNPKRRSFYRKLWAKNFSRIFKAEKAKSHQGYRRKYDVEIEVSGGVAYLVKKLPGISVQIRVYDIADGKDPNQFEESNYDEDENIEHKE